MEDSSLRLFEKNTELINAEYHAERIKDK